MLLKSLIPAFKIVIQTHYFINRILFNHGIVSFRPLFLSIQFRFTSQTRFLLCINFPWIESLTTISSQKSAVTEVKFLFLLTVTQPPPPPSSSIHALSYLILYPPLPSFLISSRFPPGRGILLLPLSPTHLWIMVEGGGDITFWREGERD